MSRTAPPFGALARMHWDFFFFSEKIDQPAGRRAQPAHRASPGDGGAGHDDDSASADDVDEEDTIQIGVFEGDVPPESEEGRPIQYVAWGDPRAEQGNRVAGRSRPSAASDTTKGNGRASRT